MRTITTLIAATLATAVVASGGAATADSKSKADKAGDASAAADVTRVQVNNEEERVSVAVKLSRAVAGRSHVRVTFTPAAEGAPVFVATTAAGVKGKASASLVSVSGEETTPVDCAGIRASVSAGREGQVRVRVPQTCFGEHAGTTTVTVASVTTGGSTADRVPGSLTVDQD